MAEFTLKLRTKEAIKENTRTLREHYRRGEISKEDMLEILEEAETEEEYEVAISVKEVLDSVE